MAERVVDARPVEQSNGRWFVRVTIRFNEPVANLAGGTVTEAPVDLTQDNTYSQASDLAYRIRTANDPTAYYRAVERNLNADVNQVETGH
jgi:hypothetical protein